jgi:hypothetical protein
MIKRVCKDLKDPDTRKTLYCSLVLPQLEHCSQLWSPIQVNQKLLLENVQRRATKFNLNYPKDMTNKERLPKLKLLPPRTWAISLKLKHFRSKKTRDRMILITL